MNKEIIMSINGESLGQADNSFDISPKQSALEILSQLPSVTGKELDSLLGKFQEALQSTVESPEKQTILYSLLKSTNPHYIPETYSENSKANILANVVAAYYAPLIHGFSSMILKNIKNGSLPSTILLPPRDTIPLAHSIKELSELMGIQVNVLQPPVTRKTAGVHNNQNGLVTDQDPLFPQLIDQLTTEIKDGGVTDVEFGIYSTTSLVMAKQLRQRSVDTYVPIKFYGLGPNISWLHAILSKGECWIAEEAESRGLVDAHTVAQTMVLIDSFEEFGMQNMYKSVKQLQTLNDGTVVPIIESVTKQELEIETATNLAVLKTADLYSTKPTAFFAGLLNQINQMQDWAKNGYPLMLSNPIPPMNNYNEHFAQIRSNTVFHYPKLEL